MSARTDGGPWLSVPLATGVLQLDAPSRIDAPWSGGGPGTTNIAFRDPRGMADDHDLARPETAGPDGLEDLAARRLRQSHQDPCYISHN